MNVKTVAWRCDWTTKWPVDWQYHDEWDPLPETWDDPPQSITELVERSDYERLLTLHTSTMAEADKRADALESRAQQAEQALRELVRVYNTKPDLVANAAEWTAAWAAARAIAGESLEQ